MNKKSKRELKGGAPICVCGWTTAQLQDKKK